MNSHDVTTGSATAPLTAPALGRVPPPEPAPLARPAARERRRPRQPDDRVVRPLPPRDHRLAAARSALARYCAASASRNSRRAERTGPIGVPGGGDPAGDPLARSPAPRPAGTARRPP